MKCLIKALNIGVETKDVFISLQRINCSGRLFTHNYLDWYSKFVDNTKLYLSLLLHFIKNGVAITDVLELLNTRLSLNPARHISHCCCKNSKYENQFADNFANFILGLSRANVPQQDIHAVLAITSKIKHENVSFLSLLVSKTGRYQNSGQIIYKFLEKDLIPESEYSSKMREPVFKYIKKFNSANREKFYSLMSDINSPFGKLFLEKAFLSRRYTLPETYRKLIKADLVEIQKQKTRTPESGVPLASNTGLFKAENKLHGAPTTSPQSEGDKRLSYKG